MTDATADSPVNVSDETETNRRPVGDRRRWLTVAKKDFADAGRSWQLYVLGGVFMTVMTFGAVMPVLSAMLHEVTNPYYIPYEELVYMADLTGVVVPVLALLFGHMAISGQRERGNLRTLLALPFTRLDVVVGSVVGRTVALWTALVVGLGVAAVPMWWFYDWFSIVTYAGFTVMVLLLASCFVSIGVSISAATPTRGRALVGAIVTLSLTVLLWDPLLTLQKVVTDVSPAYHIQGPGRAPGWYVFLDRAQPSVAWRHLVSEWVHPLFPHWGMGRGMDEPALTTWNVEPFYVQEKALFVVLLAWALVPLLIGYWRFRNAEVA